MAGAQCLADPSIRLVAHPLDGALLDRLGHRTTRLRDVGTIGKFAAARQRKELHEVVPELASAHVPDAEASCTWRVDEQSLAFLQAARRQPVQRARCGGVPSQLELLADLANPQSNLAFAQ